ncbi:MAG: DUF3800 domain-containing protein [Bacteroidetes bacterium]|nr:DUF3800 domain-containing protein [Bacteroidota bacterium]
MEKTFNLYCDESCHLKNDNFPYMLIGYIGVPFNQIDEHKKYLNYIKENNKKFGEIKWSKISNANFQLYHEIISYFFSSDLNFRAIVVKKSDINIPKYSSDYNTFYYKMYYQLIHHKIDMSYKYNIYLDKKDTLSSKKVLTLKKILQTQYGIIKNLQNINSKESIFMQIADIILGAISYNLRSENRVIAKNEIIKLIQKESNHSLISSTKFREFKLNLFFIDLK